MSPPSRNDEARLRRLERIAVLGFLEKHGIGAGMDHAASIRRLRAQSATDAAAILREHAEPILETRKVAA
jgi:hypothetical protein